MCPRHALVSTWGSTITTPAITSSSPTQVQLPSSETTTKSYPSSHSAGNPSPSTNRPTQPTSTHHTRTSSAAMTFLNPTKPLTRHLPVLPTLLQKVPILPQVKVPKPLFRNFQLLIFPSLTPRPGPTPIFSTRVPIKVIPTLTRLQHKFRQPCYHLHLLIATRSTHTVHHLTWHAACPLCQKPPRHPCSYLPAKKQSSL